MCWRLLVSNRNGFKFPVPQQTQQRVRRAVLAPKHGLATVSLATSVSRRGDGLRAGAAGHALLAAACMAQKRAGNVPLHRLPVFDIVSVRPGVVVIVAAAVGAAGLLVVAGPVRKWPGKAWQAGRDDSSAPKQRIEKIPDSRLHFLTYLRQVLRLIRHKCRLAYFPQAFQAHGDGEPLPRMATTSRTSGPCLFWRPGDAAVRPRQRPQRAAARLWRREVVGEAPCSTEASPHPPTSRCGRGSGRRLGQVRHHGPHPCHDARVNDLTYSVTFESRSASGRQHTPGLASSRSSWAAARPRPARPSLRCARFSFQHPHTLASAPRAALTREILPG